MSQTSAITAIEMEDARSFAGGWTIALSPGLNVIVGDSDVGKSNLVRNVESVLANDSLGAVLRTGAASAEIVVFASGCKVTLEKSAKTNRYLLETAAAPGTQTFDSVGASVPQAVADAINMGEVDLAGERVCLNLSRQRDPLMVDLPASAIARMVGAVSGLDVLYRAVAEAQRRSRESDAASRAATGVFRDAAKRTAELRAAGDLPKAEAALARADAAEARGTAARLRGAAMAEGVRRAREEATRAATASGRLRAATTALPAAEAAYARGGALLTRAGELAARLAAARAAGDALARVNAQRGPLRLAVEDAYDNQRAVVAELGTCPLCGGEMAADHLPGANTEEAVA